MYFPFFYYIFLILYFLFRTKNKIVRNRKYKIRKIERFENAPGRFIYEFNIKMRMNIYYVTQVRFLPAFFLLFETLPINNCILSDKQFRGGKIKVRKNNFLFKIQKISYNNMCDFLTVLIENLFRNYDAK